MDSWIGQTITLFTEIVPFGADDVPAIRVRADGGQTQKCRAPTKAETAKAAQAPLGKDGHRPLDALDDEIPF